MTKDLVLRTNAFFSWTYLLLVQTRAVLQTVVRFLKSALPTSTYLLNTVHKGAPVHIQTELMYPRFKRCRFLPIRDEFLQRKRGEAQGSQRLPNYGQPY